MNRLFSYLTRAGEWTLVQLSSIVLSLTLAVMAGGVMVWRGARRMTKFSLVIAIGVLLFLGGNLAWSKTSAFTFPGVAFLATPFKIVIGIIVIILTIMLFKRFFTKPDENWREKWWAVPLGYVVLNLLILILFPDWYVGQAASMWFWQMHAAMAFIAILFAIFSDGKSRPWLHKAGVVVFVIWIVATTGAWGKFRTWIGDKTRFVSSSTPVTTSPTPTGRARASWNWDNSNGPEKDTVMAAFPGDTVMWRIAAAESDYTQFRVNASGDSSVVQNKDGVDAYGIFQIRESVWGGTCRMQGFDIKTTAGNIGCAKMIKAKYPDARPWLASAHRWRDSTTVDPCTQYAQYGGNDGLEVLRKDTVITTGDTLYTRRIETENMYSDWNTVNFRTDYMVRYAYRDPARGYQVFVAEEVMEKEHCPEQNRLPRHPIWVEFRSLDADPIMIEVTLSQKR